MRIMVNFFYFCENGVEKEEKQGKSLERETFITSKWYWHFKKVPQPGFIAAFYNQI